MIMNFSEALLALKDGSYCTRDAWGNDFVFIEDGQFTKSSDGHCEDWTPTHEDLLAEDWVVSA